MEGKIEVRLGDTVMAQAHSLRHFKDRSAKLLFRDCMRAIELSHGRTSRAALAMKDMVRSQFRLHAKETDERKILTYKEGYR
eukprot:g4712.t1